MTREQKELLLKDLCARLPYGVKISDDECDTVNVVGIHKTAIIIPYAGITRTIQVDKCKPYLFPLSSMTEEQLYNNPIGFSQILTIKADRDWENITINRRAYYKLVDWLNKNHFDYRGLIENGLAIDATGLNIY